MKGINIYFGTISARDNPDTTEFDRAATQEEADRLIGELGWYEAKLDDIDNGGFLIDLTDEAVKELEETGEITRHSADLKLTVTIYLD